MTWFMCDAHDGAYVVRLGPTRRCLYLIVQDARRYVSEGAGRYIIVGNWCFVAWLAGPA